MDATIKETFGFYWNLRYKSGIEPKMLEMDVFMKLMDSWCAESLKSGMPAIYKAMKPFIEAEHLSESEWDEAVTISERLSREYPELAMLIISILDFMNRREKG